MGLIRWGLGTIERSPPGRGPEFIVWQPAANSVDSVDCASEAALSFADVSLPLMGLWATATKEEIFRFGSGGRKRKRLTTRKIDILFVELAEFLFKKNKEGEREREEKKNIYRYYCYYLSISPCGGGAIAWERHALMERPPQQPLSQDAR